jgi:hypothetical protein
MIYKSYVLCPSSQRFKGAPLALSCFYAPLVKLTGTVEKGLRFLKKIAHNTRNFTVGEILANMTQVSDMAPGPLVTYMHVLGLVKFHLGYQILLYSL